MRFIKPSYKIIDPLNPEYIIRKIEKCGRICYKSDESDEFEKAKEFVRKRIETKHDSIIEHFSFSVIFIIDRGISHEMVRHRLASFSQESTRYVNFCKNKFGNQLTFIIPEWLPDLEEGEYYYNISNEVCHDKKPFVIDEITSKFIKELLEIENLYMTLIKNGWTPEKARYILPNGIKTEIVVTANLREWRHILKLRTEVYSHPQMREIMRPLVSELKSKIPIIFDDIEY